MNLFLIDQLYVFIRITENGPELKSVTRKEHCWKSHRLRYHQKTSRFNGFVLFERFPSSSFCAVFVCIQLSTMPCNLNSAHRDDGHLYKIFFHRCWSTLTTPGVCLESTECCWFAIWFWRYYFNNILWWILKWHSCGGWGFYDHCVIHRCQWGGIVPIVLTWISLPKVENNVR